MNSLARDGLHPLIAPLNTAQLRMLVSQHGAETSSWEMISPSIEMVSGGDKLYSMPPSLNQLTWVYCKVSFKVMSVFVS